MKKEHHALSLRRQIILIVLLCWLLPVLMALSAMGWYFHETVGLGAQQALTAQLQTSLRMCADRVNTAAQASRLASYDPTIRTAWARYQNNGSYAELYRDTWSYLNRQYGTDSRFLYSVFWFSEDPEDMTVSSLTSVTGTLYTQFSRCWPEDFPAARELAAGLDTSVGFLERDGRIYLIRNLIGADYKPIGVLALALNPPYYFEELSALNWVSAVEVAVGDAAPIPLLGALPQSGGRILSARVDGSDYTLSALAAPDYAELMTPFRFYAYLLVGMALLLIPLLLFTVHFLQQKVTLPIAALMDGASEIEQGHLGHQMTYQANSKEFQYLTGSFNRMSGQLQHQFDRLYQEELALRDAQIKALQSHINPHFLNNTLEIINWEARMNGDAKVSKMIEALSTVLDAALDRKRAPEVRLAEEMTYVNAYLYIIAERFGKRLTVNIDLPDELMDCKVPRLILQPIIENAVEHGMGPGGRGTVSLRGTRQDGFLLLDIENDGRLTPEDEAHIAQLLASGHDAARENSGSIGIANVNARLRILYGPGCGLTITRSGEDRVLARLKIALPEAQN